MDAGLGGSVAARLRGGAPRLVWITTPVALVTGRGSARMVSSIRRETDSAT